MKRKQITKALPFLIFIILVCSLMYFTVYEQYQIKINKAETIGVISKFKSGGGGVRYSISYSFKVNNKKYYGHMGVTSFKCKNGKKACVGKEFKIYYSKKNPNYNWIDLSEYDKYRTTVKFIDLK
jgi:hypothetical protein